MPKSAGAERDHEMSVEEVDAAFVRPVEGQTLERKGPRIDGRELGNAIVGFANADGGQLVIGIQDGHVLGINRETEKQVNEWRQASTRFVQPPASLRFELIACRNASGEADRIAVLDIESSARVHRNVKGDVYLRVGDTNRRLSPTEAQELLYDKGESAFDGSAVPEAGGWPFDEQAVSRFLRAIRARSAPAEILAARGLAVERDGEARATVAGLLVLGTTPQRFLPEASVRVLRYPWRLAGDGDARERDRGTAASTGRSCNRCGAWRGSCGAGSRRRCAWERTRASRRRRSSPSRSGWKRW